MDSEKTPLAPVPERQKRLPEWAELIKRLYEEALREQKSASRKAEDTTI